MRVLVVVTVAAFAAGCTSVRMVQRDGCWIKRTEKIFGRVREEIGPCAREQPKWATDQLTRLVQECVAQADYRWQARALEAWSRSRPMPAQPPQEETLRTCMEEARVGLVNENEELKRRVTQLSADREEMQAASAQDRAHLRASHDGIAKYLGEAANRPIPPSTATAAATATSDGKATNESGASLATESGSASSSREPPADTPAIVPATPPGTEPAAPRAPAPRVTPASPAPSPAARKATPRAARIARARCPPTQEVRTIACDPPAASSAGTAGAAQAPSRDPPSP